MPNIRKLSPEEISTLEKGRKGQRKIIEEQYDALMTEYDTGDYGEAELDRGENRLTVRNRLKAAAARRGLSLDFRRSTSNTLPFRVLSGDEGTPPERRSVQGRSADEKVDLAGDEGTSPD